VVFLIAGNEESMIERCLAAIRADLVYSRVADRSEIVLVIQNLANEPVDDTRGRAHRWARVHGAPVGVRILDVRWPPGCRNFLALGRKLAVDSTLVRFIGTHRGRACCYFITEDADLEWIERGRAAAVIRLLDRHPGIDYVRGWHQRSLDLVRYLPYFVERLTWRAAEHELSRPRWWPDAGGHYNFHWNRVVTAGWNVAFTAEAYALAGGYTSSVELFEDMDLGQRISIVRGRVTADGVVPSAGSGRWLPFEACSDGRRGLLASVRGAHIYGDGPSLASFVAASAESRGLTLDRAYELIRRIPERQALDSVVKRRLDEVAAIARTKVQLDHVVAAMERELGQPLTAVDLPAAAQRQREFLAAAAAVAAGAASRTLTAALRHTAA
jgi:hypothetical protein